MKRFEPILKSGYYIGFIFLVTLFAWSFYEETPPHLFNFYNTMVIIGLAALHTLILYSFENTLYTVPTGLSLIFIINKSNMDFNTVGQLGFPIFFLIMFIAGYVVYFIKYKPTLKPKAFFLGLFLIALSYVIPLIYTPLSLSAFMVSIMGFFYLGVYVFYSNTMKGNLDYLFKVLLMINLLLTAQVGLYLYRGYLLNPELDFYHRIYAGWGRNLGWANINDMCFYIALTFPSYLYFIFKKPQTYLVWFLMLLPTAAVILSKSRGGIIGYGVVLLGIIVFFFFRGNKKHLFHGLVFLIISGLIAYQVREVFIIWWDFFMQTVSDDLNAFSSGRIDIYTFGLGIFKQYPLFGGGWLSINLYPNGNLFGGRIFMYHSTLIQALAAMGIFGLVALLIHYIQIAKNIFKHPTLEKYLFLIGYLASQAHGLIDNVQYAVPYSILMVAILAFFDTSEKKTSFETKNHRYHLIK